MSNYQVRASLQVEGLLAEFVENELLPSLEIDAETFWARLADIVEKLTPRNREVLGKRDDLQRRIDDYHRAAPGQPEPAHYRAFLEELGYIEPPREPFSISTENVDPEIASVAGPQLVVPVSNARFALNAANARWGSLYDALYGTDVIDEKDGKQKGGSYNPVRGKAVIAYAARFLDRAIPLSNGSHGQVKSYSLAQEGGQTRLEIRLDDGSTTTLEHPERFAGFSASGDKQTLLFRNNGLHFEILIDPYHPIGRDAGGHVADVILESAVTTIQDCEDSVAAVDAEDKVGVYRNWLGLMRGDLESAFTKGGKEMVRRLNADRSYFSPDGSTFSLPGRSVLLVRNVGHLMTNPAILDSNGDEIFEGIMDAIMTVTCSLHELRGPGQHSNSRTGSVYIVKPKMHGSDEAALTNDLFAMVEDMLGLDRNTIKVGVMDEERRTTVNLANSIHAVKERLVFINTGFLDRTGDEIHTSMLAGPVLPKETIKAQPWIAAYEDWNVDVGIRCGLPGKAQIGKGMWPKPDEMKAPWSTARVLTWNRGQAVHGCRLQRRLRCMPCIITKSMWPNGRLSWQIVQLRAWMKFSRRRWAIRIIWRRIRSSLNWITMPRAFSVTLFDGLTRVWVAPRCRTFMMLASWKTALPCAFPASTLPTGCITGSAASSRCAQPWSAWPRWWIARMKATRFTSRWHLISKTALPSRLPATWCSKGPNNPVAILNRCCMHAGFSEKLFPDAQPGLATGRAACGIRAGICTG